jgi:hypothetical protein
MRFLNSSARVVKLVDGSIGLVMRVPGKGGAVYDLDSLKAAAKRFTSDMDGLVAAGRRRLRVL